MNYVYSVLLLPFFCFSMNYDNRNFSKSLFFYNRDFIDNVDDVIYEDRIYNDNNSDCIRFNFLLINDGNALFFIIEDNQGIYDLKDNIYNKDNSNSNIEIKKCNKKVEN